MKKPDMARGVKLRKTGGFTLVEMLIVVAIIAILIAVSIPLVSSALEKARDATDQANERAAKAEAVLIYLGAADLGKSTTTNNDVYQDLQTKGLGFIYDAANGGIVIANGSGNSKNVLPYGKCTGCKSEAYPNSNEDHTKEKVVIGGFIASDGQVTIGWVPQYTEASSIVGVNENGKLVNEWGAELS